MIFCMILAFIACFLYPLKFQLKLHIFEDLFIYLLEMCQQKQGRTMEEIFHFSSGEITISSYF